MTGHVFHPGHHELHGITVVLETAGPVTYVGRFDTQDDEGLHLKDVAVHQEGADPRTKSKFLADCGKFGIPARRKSVTVPAYQVIRISRLAELEARSQDG